MPGAIEGDIAGKVDLRQSPLNKQVRQPRVRYLLILRAGQNAN